MAKKIGQITWFETDDGIRIDISGDKARQMFACCCGPCIPQKSAGTACCEPESERKK